MSLIQQPARNEPHSGKNTDQATLSKLNNSAAILDVLVIGAGFSGICMAIKLLEGNISNFKIYEKANGIGGTWLHNTYPGVACDVASHLYCFSFEPNPNWSKVFSPGAEIREYIEHCAEKYGVTRHIELGMYCQGTSFNEQTQLWETHFSDGHAVQSHHVVTGSGGLHRPSVPVIAGSEDFTGKTMHSAEWDHSIELTGKRIAVIGSAASAVQIVPEIAKVAAQVDVYQRTPNYIMPRNNRAYSAAEKKRLKRWPWLNRLLRAAFFYKGELLAYPLVKKKKDTRYSQRTKRLINSFMSQSIKDASLHESLTPGYSPGCKRILLSDDFFTALNRNNVSLITEGIKRIEHTGIVTHQDELRMADVIVYATGFDIDGHIASISVTGPNGLKLADLWQDLPQAYKGAMVAGLPNAYFITGPNTGVGTTSVVYMIEQQVDYIMQCITKAGRNQLLAPTPQAMAEFNEDLQEKLQETVWAGSCSSYYKRPDGRIATLYPYNARTFRKRHRHIQWNDFQIHPKTAVPS